MTRYTPPCPHYPDCFGCPLVGFPYPEQLEKKRRALAQALDGSVRLPAVEVPPVVRSPRRLGYRARVKLVVRRAGGRVETGLYAPGSHRVVDISRCPVHPEPVNRVVGYLKRLVAKLEIPVYDEPTDTGALRYLDIRYSFWRREVALTVVTRHDRFPQGGELARALMRRFPFVAGVIQNINEERGNVIWGERYRSLGGRDSIMERIGFVKLKYPAGTFSQANPAVAQRLYHSVLDLAGMSGRENVLDLYCGVGPISFYLATAARLVCGVEESPRAVAAAKQNALINGFHNCRFFAGEAGDKITEAKAFLDRIDLVVMNPPRTGVRPEAMEAVLALEAPKMIYVSCEPATLARDLDRLAGAGYRLIRLQPFDMLPQTDAIEIVTLLEKS